MLGPPERPSRGAGDPFQTTDEFLREPGEGVEPGEFIPPESFKGPIPGLLGTARLMKGDGQSRRVDRGLRRQSRVLAEILVPMNQSEHEDAESKEPHGQEGV